MPAGGLKTWLKTLTCSWGIQPPARCRTHGGQRLCVLLELPTAAMHQQTKSAPERTTCCCVLYVPSGIEPEVYPRPDGSVYVCGEPQGDVPLPPSPSDVTVMEERAAVIEHAAGLVSSALRGAEVEARQACYLPNSEDGMPLIGRCVPGVLGK